MNEAAKGNGNGKFDGKEVKEDGKVKVEVKEDGKVKVEVEEDSKIEVEVEVKANVRLIHYKCIKQVLKKAVRSIVIYTVKCTHVCTLSYE